MSIRVGARIEGLAALYAALDGATAELDAAIGGVLDATGLEVRSEIIRRYNSGPATGRIYQKYNPRRTHQASAPGQAPMSDTGRLANATTYKKDRPLAVAVENRLEYATALEYGTRTIRARPVWRQVALEAEPKLKRRLETTVAAFTR